MGRRAGAALPAVALALSIASCGGGAGGSDRVADPSEPQIAKATLITRADAICQADEARLQARAKQIPRPRGGGLEVVAPYLELNEQTVRSGARKIEALGRPTRDGALLDDYLDERETAANALEAAVRAARRGDIPKMKSALLSYGRNNAAERASDFGFKVCRVGAAAATGPPPTAP